MNPRYEYYAILTPDQPSVDDPCGVSRRWFDDDGRCHEESYLRRLAWEPTNDLTLIESGVSSAVARPISEETARAFEAIQYARVHKDDPVDGKYTYFALVEEEEGFPLDNPKGVIRTWTSPDGNRLEAWYNHRDYWRRSSVRHDIQDGREFGDLVQITEEALDRFKEIAAERAANQD